MIHSHVYSELKLYVPEKYIIVIIVLSILYSFFCNIQFGKMQSFLFIFHACTL